MSYSFSVSAKSKADAKFQVAQKMAQVARDQNCHAKDMVAACDAANMFIDMLTDDPERGVAVSMNGSVGWSGDVVTGCSSAQLSISAYLAPMPS